MWRSEFRVTSINQGSNVDASLPCKSRDIARCSRRVVYRG